MQGKYYVEIKPGWNEELSLYCLSLAEPSERKSATLSVLTKPIIEYERNYNLEHKSEFARYAHNLEYLTKRYNHLQTQAIKATASDQAAGLLGQAEATYNELRDLEENPIKPIQLMSDDITPEALPVLMRNNSGKMAIISSEGTFLQVIAGRYSQQPNIDFVLHAYYGERISVNRIGRDDFVLENPHLTIVEAIQPAVLFEMLSTKGMQGKGFFERFLLCRPESMVGDRKFETTPIPEEIEQYNHRALQDLLIYAPPTMQKLVFDDEAYNLIKQYAEKLESFLKDMRKQNTNALLIGWIGKLAGTTARITGLLHCYNYGQAAASCKINYYITWTAIRIGEYYLRQAMMIFGQSDASDNLPVQRAKYI